MNILGIDYGRKKIGLAVADGVLAEPYRVIRYSKFDEGLKKVIQVIKGEPAFAKATAGEQVDQVVIGLSEGAMAEETKYFGSELERATGITPQYFDETLTSQDAQALSIQAGMKRKKRKRMEDAFAAAVMLQEYLDGFKI